MLRWQATDHRQGAALAGTSAMPSPGYSFAIVNEPASKAHRERWRM